MGGVSMAATAAAKRTTMNGAKYLTFALGDEEYAVPVLKVREIIKMTDITSVPQLPPYVRGVINLRGRVVPVIDMRLKFGLAPRAYSERTCIVVVEVVVGENVAMMGIIVDTVCDVLSISIDDLGDAPDFDGSRGTGWIESLARVRGGVKILLNLDKMLGADRDIVHTT